MPATRSSGLFWITLRAGNCGGGFEANFGMGSVAEEFVGEGGRGGGFSGPEPSCVISKAPPRIATFFMNMITCICATMGVVIVQNLCIMGVTATRRKAMSRAPILAW
jgi:hypothetical protein